MRRGLRCSSALEEKEQRDFSALLFKPANHTQGRLAEAPDHHGGREGGREGGNDKEVKFSIKNKKKNKKTL